MTGNKPETHIIFNPTASCRQNSESKNQKQLLAFVPRIFREKNPFPSLKLAPEYWQTNTTSTAYPQKYLENILKERSLCSSNSMLGSKEDSITLSRNMSNPWSQAGNKASLHKHNTDNRTDSPPFHHISNQGKPSLTTSAFSRYFFSNIKSYRNDNFLISASDSYQRPSWPQPLEWPKCNSKCFAVMQQYPCVKT